MGSVSYVLRGISTALLVTVLTLFAGIVWGAMGLGGLSVSRLLDIGLLASCLVGGYRAAKESGEWMMGGVTGAGYVIVGTLLLALFLPIRGWGFIQVLGEGAIIGLLAGAVGARGMKLPAMGAWQGKGRHSQARPFYAGYGSNDDVDNKFDWDTEENPKDRWDAPMASWEAPMASWIETPEEKPWKSSEKRDSKEERDVEWSWDREDEDKHKNRKDREFTSLGSGYSELPEILKPEQVNIDTVGWNRRNLDISNENKARGTRPWWEE